MDVSERSSCLLARQPETSIRFSACTCRGMAARHSWEDSEGGHSWEQPPALGEDASADGNESLTREAAGREFADLLVDLYLRGQVAAKFVCTAAFWASKAGACGPCSVLAMHPSSSTGNFAKHLAVVLDMKNDDGKFLQMSVPAYRRYDLSRGVHELPVVPPHEALHGEVLRTPGLPEKLAETLQREHWAPDYLHHALVAGRGGFCLPTCLVRGRHAHDQKRFRIGLFRTKPAY